MNSRSAGVKVAVDARNLFHKRLKVCDFLAGKSVMRVYYVIDKFAERRFVRPGSRAVTGQRAVDLFHNFRGIRAGIRTGFLQRLSAAAAIVDLVLLKHTR